MASLTSYDLRSFKRIQVRAPRAAALSCLGCNKPDTIATQHHYLVSLLPPHSCPSVIDCQSEVRRDHRVNEVCIDTGAGHSTAIIQHQWPGTAAVGNVTADSWTDWRRSSSQTGADGWAVSTRIGLVNDRSPAVRPLRPLDTWNRGRVASMVPTKHHSIEPRPRPPGIWIQKKGGKEAQRPGPGLPERRGMGFRSGVAFSNHKKISQLAAAAAAVGMACDEGCRVHAQQHP